MILALIAEVVALIGAFGARKFLPHHYYIAPIFAAAATFLLLLSFVVFAAKSDYAYPSMQPTMGAPLGGQYYSLYRYGYSFWLCILAFITMTLATIFGFFALRMADSERLDPMSYSSPAVGVDGGRPRYFN